MHAFRVQRFSFLSGHAVIYMFNRDSKVFLIHVIYMETTVHFFSFFPLGRSVCLFFLSTVTAVFFFAISSYVFVQSQI